MSVMTVATFVRSIVLELWIPPFFAGLSSNYGGLSFDLDGNLYLTSFSSANTILKVNTAGAVCFVSPYDVAIDCLGTLYVSNFDGNAISKVSAQGVVSKYVSGVFRPAGLALDSSGNLYVANYDSNKVTKIQPQPGKRFVDGVLYFFFFFP